MLRVITGVEPCYVSAKRVSCQEELRYVTHSYAPVFNKVDEELVSCLANFAFEFRTTARSHANNVDANCSEVLR